MGSLRSVGTRPHPNHRQPITEQEAERKENRKKEKERDRRVMPAKGSQLGSKMFFFQRAKEQKGGEKKEV